MSEELLSPKELWNQYAEVCDQASIYERLLKDGGKLSLEKYKETIHSLYMVWGVALDLLSQYQAHPDTDEVVDKKEREDILKRLYPGYFEANLDKCREFYNQAIAFQNSKDKKKDELALQNYTVCIELASLFFNAKDVAEADKDYVFLANAFYNRGALYGDMLALSKAIDDFKEAKRYYLLAENKSEATETQEKIDALMLGKKFIEQKEKEEKRKTYRELTLEKNRQTSYLDQVSLFKDTSVKKRPRAERIKKLQDKRRKLSSDKLTVPSKLTSSSESINTSSDSSSPSSEIDFAKKSPKKRLLSLWSEKQNDKSVEIADSASTPRTYCRGGIVT